MALVSDLVVFYLIGLRLLPDRFKADRFRANRFTTEAIPRVSLAHGRVPPRHSGAPSLSMQGFLFRGPSASGPNQPRFHVERLDDAAHTDVDTNVYLIRMPRRAPNESWRQPSREGPSSVNLDVMLENGCVDDGIHNRATSVYELKEAFEFFGCVRRREVIRTCNL